MIRHGLINFTKRFVVIYGLTMLATYLYCLFLNPNCSLVVVEHCGRCLLASFIADASSFVYFSNHELSTREWWVRTAVHCAIIESVLLPLGYIWGMWSDFSGAAIYFVIILLIKLCVNLVGYGKDCAEASDLNRCLKERREKRN